MKSSGQNKARFDTRLSQQQKLFFERAAKLGGYRNLTDFVLTTLQKRAKEIIDEREQIVYSQEDSKIFFDALMQPELPNKNLFAALQDYEKVISK